MPKTLYDLITPGGTSPAWWQCPIQQGLPAMLNLAYQGLLFISALAFMVGILIAVFYYLTAYGDESRAKKGKESLKWSFIGAIVVIFSALIIQGVAGALISPTEKFSLSILDSKGNIALRGVSDDPAKTKSQLGKNDVQCGTSEPEKNSQSGGASDDVPANNSPRTDVQASNEEFEFPVIDSTENLPPSLFQDARPFDLES